MICAQANSSLPAPRAHKPLGSLGILNRGAVWRMHSFKPIGLFPQEKPVKKFVKRTTCKANMIRIPAPIGRFLRAGEFTHFDWYITDEGLLLVPVLEQTAAPETLETPPWAQNQGRP